MPIESKKIYLTRPIPEAGIVHLRAHCTQFGMNAEDRILSKEELAKAVKGVHGIVSLLTDKIDAQIMDAAGKQLKVIANVAVGYDNIDIKAANQRQIAVTNTPGVLTDATADFAWALLMATVRRIPEAERFTRAGKFKAWGATLLLGGDLPGKTLGILGAGRIGTLTAMRSIGWHMRILYTSRGHNQELETKLGASRVDFEKLLRESDFISIHVPLTKETHHIFNAETFRKMKKTAYIINTARGPVIDEAALVEAVQNGEIAGAGLDVFEREPQIHPGLFELDNVVMAPHIASATKETRDKMALMAATNAIDCLQGKKPVNLVNDFG